MSRDVDVTNIFKKNYNSNNTIVINRGGSRSSKSFSLRQLFIQRLINESNKNFLITRKTLPSLKNTEYREFIKLLREYGYYRYCEHNKTDKTLIYTPNNNYVLFTSIDDPGKIRSTEWNYIWMEETTDFKYDDYMTLKLRLSGANDKLNQLFMSFNPVDAFHWVKMEVLGKETDVQEIVSTYKDNPFLPEQYVKLLEATKTQNPNYWKIYGEGEWGVLENIIYSNWEITNDWPTPEKTIWGCDFAYRVPTAIVEVRLKGDDVYLRQHLYKTDMTNEDLMNFIRATLPPNALIYCDAAEPARIEEMRRKDINAMPADKSVKDGIDFVKRQNLKIHSSSIDLINEVRAYCNKLDKNGNPIDEPVKFNDHLMDATRYAIYTYLGKRPNYEIIS